MLPNFLCVGVQRSGTTTLHNTLNQHPDVFLPTRTKETHFFNQYYQCGALYYERAFFSDYNGQKAIGEITPIYIYLPEVAERILKTLGPIKIIVSLRNPIARAFSHYKMNYSFLWESESFEDAIRLEEDRLQDPQMAGAYSYLDRGYYAKQIKRLLEHFPKENIHFIVSELDTYVDLQKTANDVFRFLDVSEHAVTKVHSNKTVMPKIQKITQNSVLKLQNGQQFNAPEGSVMIQGGFGLPFSITNKPSPEFTGFIEKHQSNADSSLTDERRIELVNQYFKDDIKELEGLLERDLSVWFK